MDTYSENPLAATLIYALLWPTFTGLFVMFLMIILNKSESLKKKCAYITWAAQLLWCIIIIVLLLF